MQEIFLKNIFQLFRRTFLHLTTLSAVIVGLIFMTVRATQQPVHKLNVNHSQTPVNPVYTTTRKHGCGLVQWNSERAEGQNRNKKLDPQRFKIIQPYCLDSLFTLASGFLLTISRNVFSRDLYSTDVLLKRSSVNFIFVTRRLKKTTSSFP